MLRHTQKRVAFESDRGMMDSKWGLTCGEKEEACRVGVEPA